MLTTVDPRLVEITQAGLVSFGVATVAAPFIFRMLLKKNSRQIVSEHVPEHAQKQGTPTMGGLIVVLGVLAAMLAGMTGSDWFRVVAFVWFAFIGFLDDFVLPRAGKGKRGLGWIPKLALQFAPFLALGLFTPGMQWWQVAIVAFVVLFFANAYNFADGMDGLAGGVGVQLALGLTALCWVGGQAHSGAALVALAVAFVPFLYYNAPPARVFMGDVGALPIGALLGLGFIDATMVASDSRLRPDLQLVLLCLPLLVILIVEIVPGPLQIASAKLRKGKRLFPFKTPVHHGFQAAGWPETRVVVLFQLVQFVGLAATLLLVLWSAIKWPT